MSDCVDADMEADENSAFMDVRDGSGIFALNLALTQILFAGVSVYALDIRLYRDVFEGVELDAQDADKNLLAHMEALGGVSHQPSSVSASRQNGFPGTPACNQTPAMY